MTVCQQGACAEAERGATKPAAVKILTSSAARATLDHAFECKGHPLGVRNVEPVKLEAVRKFTLSGA
jgi:hypothetical protein